jgi:uncharacterized protein (TIGR02145 family)
MVSGNSVKRYPQIISCALMAAYGMVVLHCGKTPAGLEGQLPTVTTAVVVAITSSSALCGGTVTSDGGRTVTTRGVCWGTAPGVTIKDERTNDGEGTGLFTSQLSGLTAQKKYYVRAYAINSIGTGYGEELFFTAVDGTQEVVQDIDGNQYRSVRIGAQVWMAENLRVTHYRNGDALAKLTDSTRWASSGEGAYCAMLNNENWVRDYGRLYNLYAAVDSRGLAPEGWHIPSDAEWQYLIDYLGGDAMAGAVMMEAGYRHWAYPNTVATNTSGFTALPGGYRNGNLGSFHGAYMSAYFWSSTKAATGGYWYRNLAIERESVIRDTAVQRNGFSLRCVKN